MMSCASCSGRLSHRCSRGTSANNSMGRPGKADRPRPHEHRKQEQGQEQQDASEEEEDDDDDDDEQDKEDARDENEEDDEEEADEDDVVLHPVRIWSSAAMAGFGCEAKRKGRGTKCTSSFTRYSSKQ